jgi:sigma-54 dependent transcriptional regulator, acetoin dehydrogenase operon transcriptional activator AcoR
MSQRLLVDTIASRENLMRVLDNLQEGIIAHDLERKIYLFNAEAERVTGYSRQEVLGRDCHDIFEGPFCGSRCSFCDGGTVCVDRLEYPLTLTTKGGELRRVDFTATMVRDENDRCVGVVASFRDITDLMELQRRSGEIVQFANIIGGDRKMINVFQQIQDVAQYDFPVHLSGETGTGKELVANAIHNESRRGGAPFVPINCGALPEGLIESELFGHVKGAFSGAIRDKKGRFELADGGTVFLDEVAELTKPLQVKLLRFLQEGRFEKVGGEKTIDVNVRVISATNKDLKKEVRGNTFREDLFYRLNVIPIHIPPLRERKNDIPLLVDHFLNQVAQRSGRPVPRLSDSALPAILDYSWPGNVRELQNALQFAFVKCKDMVITRDDLPLELRQMNDTIGARRGPVKKLDIPSVRSALGRTGGNKARAARELGVGRATLYRFIRENPEAAEVE